MKDHMTNFVVGARSSSTNVHATRPSTPTSHHERDRHAKKAFGPTAGRGVAPNTKFSPNPNTTEPFFGCWFVGANPCLHDDHIEATNLVLCHEIGLEKPRPLRIREIPEARGQDAPQRADRHESRELWRTLRAHRTTYRQCAHACKNSLRRPVEAIDAAVVEWIRSNVVDEELIALTIDKLRHRMGARAENSANVVPEIEAQMAMVKVELERHGNALVGANEKPEMVLRMIAEREKKLADLEVRLVEERVSPRAMNTRGEDIEKAVRERLQGLHGLFARHPEAAHRVMEAMLGGR